MRAKRRQSLPHVKSLKLFLAKLATGTNTRVGRYPRLRPAVLFRPARPPNPRTGRLRWRMWIAWTPVRHGEGIIAVTLARGIRIYSRSPVRRRSGLAVRLAEVGDAWPDPGLAGAPDLYLEFPQGLRVAGAVPAVHGEHSGAEGRVPLTVNNAALLSLVSPAPSAFALRRRSVRIRCTRFTRSARGMPRRRAISA